MGSSLQRDSPPHAPFVPVPCAPSEEEGLLPSGSSQSWRRLGETWGKLVLPWAAPPLPHPQCRAPSATHLVLWPVSLGSKSRPLSGRPRPNPNRPQPLESPGSMPTGHQEEPLFLLHTEEQGGCDGPPGLGPVRAAGVLATPHEAALSLLQAAALPPWG